MQLTKISFNPQYNGEYELIARVSDCTFSTSYIVGYSTYIGGVDCTSCRN